MSEKVVRLRLTESKTEASVVDALEALLALARAGDLSSIAFAATIRGGTISTDYFPDEIGTAEAHQLAGSVGVVYAMLMRDLLNVPREVLTPPSK